MKKFIVLISFILTYFISSGQEYRLFLVDQYNGNYTEIELDNEMTFAMEGLQQTLTGRIIEVKKKSILFQTTNSEYKELPIDNITSIIELKRMERVKNSPIVVVVKVLVGTFIGLYGVTALIGGFVILPDDAASGVALIVIGGLLSTASYSLYNSAFGGSKNGTLTPVLLPLDGERYRLVIR